MLLYLPDLPVRTVTRDAMPVASQNTLQPGTTSRLFTQSLTLPEQAVRVYGASQQFFDIMRTDQKTPINRHITLISVSFSASRKINLLVMKGNC